MKLIEFPINVRGDFEVSGYASAHNVIITYHWTSWNGPVKDRVSGNFVNPCKVFAGWHYPLLGWFMHPILVMYGNDGKPIAVAGYSNEDSVDLKPIEPDKIRYWSYEE